jgi:hypothetical protein
MRHPPTIRSEGLSITRHYTQWFFHICILQSIFKTLSDFIKGNDKFTFVDEMYRKKFRVHLLTRLNCNCKETSTKILLKQVEIKGTGTWL